MPMTSSATTSGMTVILSALSHRPPMKLADLQRRLAQAVAERLRARAGQQADDERDQDQIGAASANARGGGVLARPWSLRLPEAVHERGRSCRGSSGRRPASCDRQPDCAAGRCFPPARSRRVSKSALTIAGSMRWSFSTTCARVAAGSGHMVDDRRPSRPASSRRRAVLSHASRLHPRDLAARCFPNRRRDSRD